MFQSNAIKGVIDALTRDNSTLATKTDLNPKIDNLHQTMDSIKQLIIDRSTKKSTTAQRQSRWKTAV